ILNGLNIMKTVKAITLILSSVVLGACTAETQIIPQEVKIEQLQHNWKLTHIDNIQLATVINSTLMIDPANKSTGNLGCNNFVGTAEFSDNQLRISKMANTRKMCGELKNGVEMDVTSVLSDWSNVMVDNDSLIIGNNKHSLTYQLAK
ncbi:META domain-containing protein, partial [Psychromonas sp.]|uniref:META domain-containing protein n=2 Tax=Psychromonas TaxID=67572 RepID=UPI003A974106